MGNMAVPIGGTLGRPVEVQSSFWTNQQPSTLGLNSAEVES